MSLVEREDMLEHLDVFLDRIRDHARACPENTFSGYSSRPPVEHYETGGVRRFALGKVVTYTIEITEPGDPIAEMFAADEEKKGWEHMLRESVKVAQEESAR